MKGIGILINILSVVVGGGFGVMIRGKLKVHHQQLIYRLVGLTVLGVGIYEFIQHYFVLTGKEIELTGSLLVLLALLIGGLFGYLLDLHGLVDAVGVFLSGKDKINKEKERARLQRLSQAVDVAVEKGVTPPKVGLLDRSPTYEMPAPLSNNLYADGFVLSVVLLCANSMLFNGVMADATMGETNILLVKSLVDFLVCFFLGQICGSGCMYAVLPLCVINGFWYVFFMVAPNFTAEFFDVTLTAQLSVIGAVILLFLGFQMAFDQKKIKPVNLIPAFLVPVLYYGILFVTNLIIGD